MKTSPLCAMILALLVGGCGEDQPPGGPQASPKQTPLVPPPTVENNPSAGTEPKEFPAGYAGSSACKGCHQPEYYYWMRTPHSYMARTLEIERQIPRSPTTSPGFPYPGEQVAIVLGILKKQVYLTKVGNEHRFLPQQYNLATEKWEVFDINEWEPPLAPGSATPTWNDNCAGCHTTGYDPAKRTFVELSIACEECHGPGARHSRTKSKDDIVNPASLPPDRAMSVCAQCHARGLSKDGKFPYAAEFLPGQNISEYMTHVEPKYGENTPFFWGNGMAAKHHQQYQEFTQSRHAMVGVVCLDCHKGHRLKLREPPSRSRLTLMTVERQFLAARTHSVCVGCHIQQAPRDSTNHGTTLFPDVQSHTHHPVRISGDIATGTSDPEGAKREMLCNDCHMPRTAPDALHFSMHTHTFRVPDIGASERYGVPNGCTSCHRDHDAAWATDKIRKIWLNGELVRTHCARFVNELTELKKVWDSSQWRLSELPPDKYPQALVLAQELASFEKVASLVVGVATSSLERGTPMTESDYAAYDKVRNAEPALYHLGRGLLALKEKISSDLKSLVDANALAALNHVLGATGQALFELPELAESYAQSASLYRQFDSKVQEKGKAQFEGKGLKTTWQEWLTIYAELQAGKFTRTQAGQLKELADHGILRYEVILKK